jgi:secreted trypsin-like serine protease
MNTLKILSFLLASAPAFAAVLDNIDFFSIASNATEGQGAFRCGASLIYPDILLTASFCIIAGDVIRVGYKNDTYSHAIRTATLVRNHPKAGGVHDENYANDLALVKLDEPVMDIVPLVSAIHELLGEPIIIGTTVVCSYTADEPAS